MVRLLCALILSLLLLPSAAAAQAPAIDDPGPCTAAAALGMPEGDDHEHNEPAQHQGLSCRIERASFLPLTNGEFVDPLAPNSKLGETDVKGDILAVAVQEPVGGALFFDVSDPAKPRFLSSYAHAACALGSNCGAYIEMMADGKSAILSLQQTDLMPGLISGSAGQAPGVALIDLSDPKNPVLEQEYLTVSVQGVHTARSHVIAEGPAAGEYVFLIQNGVGTDIARVIETPAGKRMVHVSTVPVVDTTNIVSTHDTFIQTDPTDGKTYLYAAGGFTYGFRVYDVSNPATPTPVANWDLTPQCRDDWYAHTIDVTTIGGRRYVTMPAESFDFGGQADASDECGERAGNGDRPGPLWIVDATDFSKLPTENDDADAIREKSAAALVTTWTNPAGRAAGQLTFSPHNQQIVGDRIFLSHYHGGVFVLDASAAFAGKDVRPKEVAWAVPFDADVRPTIETGTFPHSRGDFWDMNFYKGHILATDIKGGIYSLRVQESGSGTAGDTAGGCDDRTKPASRWKGRLSRRGVTVRGTARDAGCDGTIKRVMVAVARERGRKCSFLNGRGKVGKARSCRKPRYVTAKGTSSFSLRIKGRLLPARYRIAVRAVDGAGNLEKLRYSRVKLR